MQFIPVTGRKAINRCLDSFYIQRLHRKSNSMESVDAEGDDIKKLFEHALLPLIAVAKINVMYFPFIYVKYHRKYQN